MKLTILFRKAIGRDGCQWTYHTAGVKMEFNTLNYWISMPAWKHRGIFDHTLTMWIEKLFLAILVNSKSITHSTHKIEQTGKTSNLRIELFFQIAAQSSFRTYHLIIKEHTSEVIIFEKNQSIHMLYQSQRLVSNYLRVQNVSVS